MRRNVVILATLLGAALLAPQAAQAVPSFTKQTGMACSGCHTAFPTLNQTGINFKKAGYRMGEMADQSPQNIGDVTLDGQFPLGFRLIGRLADNKQTDKTKIDALHEVEIFIAGHPGDDLSVFAEVEGEEQDLTTGGGAFALAVKGAALGWHASPEFAVLAGYAPVFHADPYDTLADGGRRMTADHKGILDLKTRNGNKQRLRDPVQQINVTGQIGSVWYLAGISGGGKSSALNGKKNGADPGDYQARLAVDLPADVMVGGFYYGGTDTLTAGDDEFQVYGIDLRHDSGALGATVLAAALWSEDDVAGVVDEVSGGYVEVLRPFDVGGRQLVPLVRYNWGDADSATPATATALENAMRKTTLQVGYYPRENARLTVEFTNYDEVVNNQRLVLGLDVAF